MDMSNTKNVVQEGNVNWIECDECGAQRFIDPKTGEAQPCADCQSKALQAPLLGGGVLVALIAIPILAAMIFAAFLLLVQFE